MVVGIISRIILCLLPYVLDVQFVSFSLDLKCIIESDGDVEITVWVLFEIVNCGSPGSSVG